MIDGVLVLDKPAGITSQQAVSRVRRALGVRRVGHAGTLDPMATGVLVVMVGEATKLAPYLTSADKRYLATVQLGIATTTLDAEGEVVERAPLPAWWPSDEAPIEPALVAERARSLQAPPIFSAIKVDGRRAHRRARAGEEVALEPRAVTVRSLELRGRDIQGGRLELELEVSKGYYVRSLARDLGEALGVPAHLSALRRIQSGGFTLDGALELASLGPDIPLWSLERAAALAMACVELVPRGVERARHGAKLEDADFTQVPPPGPSAWLSPEGVLIAVGTRRDDGWAVLRGFRGTGHLAAERESGESKNGP